jgi:hypothetical protein
MVRVLETLGFSFGSPPNDPMVIVKGLLAHTVSDEDRRIALDYWWDIVYERGIRDLQSRDALMARLAVSLLSPAEVNASPELGEHLSWFLEVLGFLKLDMRKAISIMEEHFKFQEKRE